MPDGALPGPAQTEQLQARADRKLLIGFAADAATELALRDGFADGVPQGPDIRRATIHEAIDTLRRVPTPQVLVVDVSGQEQPLAALEDLAQVVEPDVRVLVVGDRTDMDFYRRLTRGLGVFEYLFKPLVPEIVARLFVPALGGRAESGSVIRGGRVIAVTGARGGIGTSTIAANLAFYLGALENRHTVLLDPNLQTGTAALLLGTQATPALRSALENPQRVDELYIERAVQAAHPRLHVLSSEEALDDAIACAPGAPERVLEMLQRRYNFIVIDLPFGASPLVRSLRARVHQSVIVMDPSLPAIRDTLRLTALATGAAQVRRPVVVLNRAGRPGGMTLKQVEEAMAAKPDVVVPDLARRAGEAELLGKPAAQSGRMRAAIADLAFRTASIRASAPPRRRLLGMLRK